MIKPVSQESTPEEEQVEEPVQKYKFFNIFPEEDNDMVTETVNDGNNKNEQPIENTNTTLPEMTFNISDIENFNSDDQETSDHQELPEMKPDEIEEIKNIEEKEELPNELIENNQEYDFENFNPIIHNDFAGEEIKEEDVEFFEEEPSEQIQEPEIVEKPKERRN